MHCKQCGAEINDGAKFCGVCGTPTVAAAASAVGDAIYVEAQPIESQSVEAQFQAAEDAEAAACPAGFASRVHRVAWASSGDFIALCALFQLRAGRWLAGT